MIPAAILSIIFSVAGIIVPEADAIVGRRLEKPKCVVKYVIITKPVSVHALRRLLAQNTRGAP
jgi:hypothetical protein